MGARMRYKLRRSGSNEVNGPYFFCRCAVFHVSLDFLELSFVGRLRAREGCSAVRQGWLREKWVNGVRKAGDKLFMYSVMFIS